MTARVRPDEIEDRRTIQRVLATADAGMRRATHGDVGIALVVPEDDEVMVPVAVTAGMTWPFVDDRGEHRTVVGLVSTIGRGWLPVSEWRQPRTGWPVRLTFDDRTVRCACEDDLEAAFASMVAGPGFGSATNLLRRPTRPTSFPSVRHAPIAAVTALAAALAFWVAASDYVVAVPTTRDAPASTATSTEGPVPPGGPVPSSV